MEFVRDVKWKPHLQVHELVSQFATNGYQSIELYKAADVLYKMWSEKAKVFLTFTSNLGTSGMRGWFAQLIQLGLVDVVVTTAGAIEEDIMRAHGEKFQITRFNADDIQLHEEGKNRVGNLIITNDSYGRFENIMRVYLDEIISKTNKISGAELLKEIGLKLSDENSFLYQAAKKNVPVFCPAITDGAIGFHLYLAKQRHPEFQLDVVDDFKNIMFATSYDDRKGLIVLGGGVSKHFAILSMLINGGADYAIYLTTASHTSGSMSGATTNEAKSWGKLKDDSDSVTVKGDVTITFPLVASYALQKLYDEGVLNWQNSY